MERDALNVTGIAKSAIETFVKNGFLMTFADLYHLDTYKEQIVAMDGFGEKSYNNMIKAIEQSRNTTFRQLFYALGIPGVGHDVAKILQKELAEPVAETLVNLVFSENALEKLMAMNGIGKVNASSIINWFKKNIKEYTDLCDWYGEETARNLAYELWHYCLQEQLVLQKYLMKEKEMTEV